MDFMYFLIAKKEAISCTLSTTNLQKIQFHFNTKIQNLIIQNNTIQAIQLSNQQIIQLDILILATGGKSYPILGATGDGLNLSTSWS